MTRLFACQKCRNVVAARVRRKVPDKCPACGVKEWRVSGLLFEEVGSV